MPTSGGSEGWRTRGLRMYCAFVSAGAAASTQAVAGPENFLTHRCDIGCCGSALGRAGLASRSFAQHLGSWAGISLRRLPMNNKGRIAVVDYQYTVASGSPDSHVLRRSMGRLLNPQSVVLQTAMNKKSQLKKA